MRQVSYFFVCIIVTSIHEKEIGFIVDEVIDINEPDVSAPPSVSEHGVSDYLAGVSIHDGKIVLLVDATKILSVNVLGNLKNVEKMDNVKAMDIEIRK